MSAVDSIGSFEEYLIDHGKIDEAHEVRTGNVNDSNDSPVVAFAKENDIFTAEKKFAPTMSSEKETSGAGAASSGGGGFLANVVSGASSFVIANLDIDAPTIPGATPTVTGETPAMASALQQPSGSESSDSQGGATSNNSNHDVMNLYNQYLNELNQAEIADEEGIPESTGEGTLSVGDTLQGVSEVGSSGATEGTSEPSQPSAPQDTGDVDNGTDTGKGESSSDIDKQQEKQLQEQMQRQLEEQQRQSRFFNNV